MHNDGVPDSTESAQSTESTQSGPSPQRATDEVARLVRAVISGQHPAQATDGVAAGEAGAGEADDTRTAAASRDGAGSDRADENAPGDAHRDAGREAAGGRETADGDGAARKDGEARTRDDEARTDKTRTAGDEGSTGDDRAPTEDGGAPARSDQPRAADAEATADPEEPGPDGTPTAGGREAESDAGMATPASDWPAMDIFSLARVGLRRWYVVLIGIALTGVAVVMLMGRIEPTYATSTSFLLQGSQFRFEAPRPAEDVEPEVVPVNPYESPSLTSRVLVETLASPTVKRTLLGDLEGADYELTQPYERSGLGESILTLTAFATSAGEAEDLFEAVTAHVEDELEEQQADAGFPSELWVTLEPLARPDTMLESRNLSRPLATIAGLGGVATLTATVLIDGIAARRRRRRSSPVS